MEIVIAHSHLNPGGVTRIIESQVKSLKNDTVSIIVGSNSEEKIPAFDATKLSVIKSLNYLERRPYSDKEAMVLLHQIHAAIKRHVPWKSVLHFHNLNLGKNPLVTYAVYLLAKEGYKVFNHAHDFAEDRPANYQFLKEILSDIFLQKIQEVLYPQLPNYHYGVLNSSDYERLLSYGVQKERIEWLPNPVTFNIAEKISKPEAKKNICKQLGISGEKLLVTYPVRVIQRKNIGEFILLSVLFENQANFAVTQAPKNPEEIKQYEKWVNFCHKQHIPIIFEAGNKCNFEELLIASNFCITSSYKEGFGMVYLEPWLANTPVVGRNIAFITQDFMADGFEFPGLYNEIKIPGFNADFKDLDTPTQMQVIADLQNKKLKNNVLFQQNKKLLSLFDKVKPSVFEHNISLINNNYSLEGYGIKLQNRYKKIPG